MMAPAGFAASLVHSALRSGADQGWKTAAEDASTASVSLGAFVLGIVALFVMLVGILIFIEFARTREAKYGWQAAGCAVALMALFDLMKYAG